MRNEASLCQPRPARRAKRVMAAIKRQVFTDLSLHVLWPLAHYAYDETDTMNVTEITVTYGGKLNLGNYNSAHIEISATALLDAGERLDEASAQLLSQIKAEVRVHVAELARKRGAQVDEIFAGLPVEARSQIQE